MLKRMITTGLLLAAAYVVLNTLPDVRRYLKIRDM